MVNVVTFTFNAFQENSYLLYDDSLDCVIIDPGCYSTEEKAQLKNTIEKLKLKPVRLLNTHCHIDHVLGNAFCAELYNLELEAHEGEIPVLEACVPYAKMMGLNEIQASPLIKHYLKEGDTIEFGNTTLEIFFTPGHSPASIVFFSRADKVLIGGDVLFEGSIGRVDLPGGNLDILLDSIEQKILPLGDDVEVYPGHGASTTVGKEKQNNPFLTMPREQLRKFM